MPYAKVRNGNVHYEVMGDGGPWFVLTTGGRSGLRRLVNLGENLSNAGYRVLLHDRRNTGASEVSISDEPFEDAMFADDVAELLDRFEASPAIALGTAAGNRLCLTLATRHPENYALSSSAGPLADVVPAKAWRIRTEAVGDRP